MIPPHALRGQKAVMRCNYDLEGDRLYSVKWYYNQKEFYRFIPTDNPKVTIFNNHRGVNVNVSSLFLTKNCRYLLDLKIGMFLNNALTSLFQMQMRQKLSTFSISYFSPTFLPSARLC